MKSHFTACWLITAFLVLTCTFHVRAEDTRPVLPPGPDSVKDDLQTAGPFTDTAQVFDNSDSLPVYEVEHLYPHDGDVNIVFPVVYNGSLYAFSLNQRDPVWRIFIGGDLLNPFTLLGDTVYFHDIYNRVYAINMREGKILWKLNLGNEIRGKIKVYGRLVIVPTLGGVIQFIDRESGEMLFRYEGEGEINAGLTVHQYLLIVPYRNGRVVAYNMLSRDVLWSFNSRSLISVQPVVRDNRLYIGSWDDTLYSLDAMTGTLIWERYVGNTITRDFIVFDDEIILFFSDGEMVCLSRDSGEIRWVKRYKNVEFNFNYFAGDDVFYIFMPDFFALRPDDGEILFEYRERAFSLYKDMLFDNMVEGVHPLSEEERVRLLSDRYFSVSSYPYLPPAFWGSRFAYFIADDRHLYVYDIWEDFFILKYALP
jgi:outer membrane protein assembly factor BamB